MTTESTPNLPLDTALYDEYPLVIQPELARAIGLNEAIVVQQLKYWTKHNKKAGRNEHDGHTWTFGSYEYWQTQFPWWSVGTVRRTFDNLEKLGVIVAGCFNLMAQDRTKWYRVNEEVLAGSKAAAEAATPFVENDRPCAQNEQMQPRDLSRPLPEINTETNNQRLTSETNPNTSDDEEEGQAGVSAATEAVAYLKETLGVTPNHVQAAELEELAQKFSLESVKAAVQEVARRDSVKDWLPYLRTVLENDEKEKRSAEEKEWVEQKKKATGDSKEVMFESAPHCTFSEREILDLADRFGSGGGEDQAEARPDL